MLSSRGKPEFGDKLTPKLISAVSQSVIATRRGLYDTEHQLLTHTLQELIDRAGHEIGGLWQPLLQDHVDDTGNNLPDNMREFIGNIVSGENQWQAILGQTALFTASSLSSAISNAVAPIAYRLNALGPNLNADPATYAQFVARGIDSLNDGQKVAYENGLGGGNFDDMVMLAQTIPDVTTLVEWMRRGLISEGVAKEWLTRAGFPPNIQQFYVDLIRSWLSPADAALAVLRGDTTQGYANQIAAVNGLTQEDFNILTLNTGEPPGLMMLLEGYRRQFITKATLENGIRQSRIRNEWIPFIEQMQYEPISTADAVQAAVQGYITPAQAKTYAAQNGLDPNDFQTLLDAAGEPISRTEMLQLWRRGLVQEQDVKNAIAQSRVKDSYIDWAVLLKDNPMSTADAIEAYVQGYLTQAEATAIAEMNGLRSVDIPPLMLTAGEPLSKTEMLTLYKRGQATEAQVKAALQQSRLKDSYIDLTMDLAVELPALYEIRALLSSGALTAVQGTTLLLQQGYEPAIVKAIVGSLTGGVLAQTKVITESQITNLYLEQEITSTEFIQELGAIGYSQTEAELIQEVNDWKASIASRNAVISKVRAQYIARRISEQVAIAELDAVQISSSLRDKLLADWDIEIAINIRPLSEAQIIDAWKLSLFEQGDAAANTTKARDYLMILGYTAADSLILLEIANKGPLDATAKAKPATPKGTTTATTSGATGS
jgi:hypothetical protein